VLPVAFVVINTEIGYMDAVLEEVRAIEGVQEAHSVFGVYDIIAKIEAGDMSRLKNIVTARIRGLNNVRSTLTMIVMEKEQ
jgi:DNA-binding Lrp family transcriptional regulator